MDVERYARESGPALVRYAYLLCGDAQLAEDLVQIAFLKAMKSWRRVEASGNGDLYMKKVVANAFIDHRRLRRNAEAPTGQEFGVSLVAPAEAPGQFEERDMMWGLLSTLPPRQRAVLVLRYYEDLSDQDIASVLEMAASTVRSTAARALGKLAQKLGKLSPVAPRGEL